MAAVSPASAYYFVKPSVRETLGSGQYYGTSDYVDAGTETLDFKPSFSSYHSASSSGTYNTYSLDVNYNVADYTLTLTGGLTPTVNDYNDYSAGGEVAREFNPGDKGFFKRVDLGGGVLQTIHGQKVTVPAIRAGTFSIPASTGTIHIQQFDAQGNISVTIPDATLSLNLTKSVYDRDVARLAVRAASVTKLAGLNQTIQGFPDNHASLKAELELWDDVTPYVSYSYTSFKAQEPIAVGYTVGSLFRWGGLRLDGSYQRFAQRGAADIDYYSLGASYRFEAGE